MKKKKQLNNYSIAHKLKDNPAQKKWRKQREKRGFDDTEIWNIQFEEDQGTREYIEKMEKEWPGGRPEDYYYQ